jgi:phytoene synthase
MRTARSQSGEWPVVAIESPAGSGAIWSLPEAYRYCERLARSHYENFPVGSLVFPRRLRKHFWAIYAFARIADDFADERLASAGGPLSPPERLDHLARWSEMLDMCYAGEASHPVFVALASTVNEFALPKSLFDDLLSAFRQDVTKRRYADFGELLDYCARSANPVGRLVLMLFGYQDDSLTRCSDDICTALQLTNHWQDVGIDLANDRIYIPVADLECFGLTAANLATIDGGESFKALMKAQVGRTRELYERGKPLCRLAPGRLGIELRAIWLGGSAILDRIEENHYDVLRRRPTLDRSDKLRIAARAFLRRGFSNR